MQTTPNNSTRLLRRREVFSQTGLTRSGLYALLKHGLFPQPVRISERSVAWPDHEVQSWISGRINERDGAK
jgi:prophage regulatory protein